MDSTPLMYQPNLGQAGLAGTFFAFYDGADKTIEISFIFVENGCGFWRRSVL
jgi:hypothetical protein